MYFDSGRNYRDYLEKLLTVGEDVSDIKKIVKVSIITVTYNSKKTIRDTMESVLSQDYEDIEYIIVDGGSTDGTIDIVKSYSNEISKVINEKDDGIYDAINKGIKLASGDIVGNLNSDDVYFGNNVISTVVKYYNTENTDSVFSDLVLVKRDNLQKIIRFYSASNFNLKKFEYGWMPPHPTFFVKREIYKKYGLFKTDYKIASDFELMVRFLVKHRISYSYIPKVLVRMRVGGVSTRNLRSNWILNKEILRACNENGVKTNVFKVLSKYITKVFQLVNRPK